MRGQLSDTSVQPVQINLLAFISTPVRPSLPLTRIQSTYPRIPIKERNKYRLGSDWPVFSPDWAQSGLGTGPRATYAIFQARFPLCRTIQPHWRQGRSFEVSSPLPPASAHRRGATRKYTPIASDSVTLPLNCAHARAVAPIVSSTAPSPTYILHEMNQSRKLRSFKGDVR